MTSERLLCPRCGIRFEADEEGAFATCPACGSRLHLGDESELAHQKLVPVSDEAAVLGRLSRWLRDREVTADPKEVVTRLLFFPFWLLPGDALVPAAPLLASNLAAFRLPAGDRVAFREGASGSRSTSSRAAPPGRRPGSGFPPSGPSRRAAGRIPEADLRAARLVSLACRVSTGSVAEKVSGFTWPVGTLRPPVA